MMKMNSRSRWATAIALPMSAFLLVACASAETPATTTGTTDSSSAESTNPEVTLRIASTPGITDPVYYCGLEVLEETVEAAGVGITIELFPGSQLGPDTERFPALQAGDIDIDLQGASALSNSYPLIGTLDAAYVFDDVDHKFSWFDNHSGDLMSGWEEATGTTIVNGWLFGLRTFTSTEPIYGPDDLANLRIRFPGTPAFIANAEALGANPVNIAFEEIYSALSTGLAEGQENPIATTDAGSFNEPLAYASLNNHQVGIQWLVMNSDKLASLTDEQRDVLLTAIADIRTTHRSCLEDATQEILDRWVASGEMTVIPTEDIDMEAFISGAEAYFLENFEGEQLDLYKAIRATAP
jgi:TRAP-type C4-dicarboxylate transport system substrate-binding protein